MNNLVAPVIVEVTIGLSSRLRAQKKRMVDILAVVVVVVVDAAAVEDTNEESIIEEDSINNLAATAVVEVTIYCPSFLLKTQQVNL